MSPTITVRSARAEDKQAVISFCQNTFSWGDYISDVYDDWLADPEGQLIVGLVDEQPVAILHLALLGNRVGWMEGMRVHPEYRRMGLATAIDTAGRVAARERGCTIVRLATSIKNLPAQRSLEPLGYRFLTRTDEWVAPPLDSANFTLPVATFADVSRILASWERSPLRSATAGLVQDPKWRWTELTSDRVLKEVKDSQIRILADGFSIVRTYLDPAGAGEFNIEAFVGDSNTIRTLALGVRSEAGIRGFRHVEAMVPHDDGLAGILSNAGYIREGAMLIFEINL